MQSLDLHEEFQGFLFFKLCEMFLGTIWVPREKRIWQNGDVKNFQLPNSYQLKIKITLKGLCLFCLNYGILKGKTCVFLAQVNRESKG